MSKQVNEAISILEDKINGVARGNIRGDATLMAHLTSSLKDLKMVQFLDEIRLRGLTISSSALPGTTRINLG